MAVDPLSELREAVGSAAASTGAEISHEPAIERPKRAEQGDYSTNAAMLLAPVLGSPPREIAGRLASELETSLGASLDRLEVAGPGFVNLFLSDAWHRRGVATVLEADR
ncbi:MAG: arginine--tRNA ligase, partial [Actinomycetota bacterium]|nr:arginine--tRNA ligase [Actinomycetota bacterium]